jgi:hypothetical protein
MTKQEILAEIRRLATVHGRAPGKDLFYKETDIRESAWSGRHWARWSDAVQEAGLRPNTLGHDEIPTDVVIGHYVALMRELGRVPVTTEVKLKRQRDRSFPSRGVFERLGSKRALLARVREYGATRPDFEDVLAMLPAAGDPPPPTDSPERADGFVYLLRAGTYYKIGRTNSTGRREYELAIQLPQKPTKVHEIRTDDPAGIEAYWHQRFAAKRANGEWFALDRDDVKAFRRRKFM